MRGAALRPVCEVHASAIARRRLRLSSALFSADTPAISPGTWCSVITPVQHAGGPGFNPQCVHASAHSTCSSCCFSAAFTTDGCARFSRSRPCARDGAAGGAADTYALRGSNPRPIAHRTIALTIELREHAVLAMPMPSCGIGASALRSLCCALGATRSLRRQSSGLGLSWDSPRTLYGCSRNRHRFFSDLGSNRAIERAAAGNGLHWYGGVGIAPAGFEPMLQKKAYVTATAQLVP